MLNATRLMQFIGLIKSNMRIAFNVSMREENQTVAFSAERARATFALINRGHYRSLKYPYYYM